MQSCMCRLFDIVSCNDLALFQESTRETHEKLSSLIVIWKLSKTTFPPSRKVPKIHKCILNSTESPQKYLNAY